MSGRQARGAYAGLRPGNGFNWLQVAWCGPDEPPAQHCSYCDQPIPEDAVPVMLFNQAGWCARFCDDCQRRHWGMRG